MDSPEDQQHSQLSREKFFDHSFVVKMSYLFRRCFHAITNKKPNVFCFNKYHQIIPKEDMKAAPEKSHFFLTRVKFLGHNIERNTITPLKSHINAIIKLQSP